MIVKSTLTVILVLASHSTVRAEDCRATTVLRGDGALVDAIDTTLTERGIATRATAACPNTTALVERRDNAIAVTITDPHGRRSTRILDDVDAAATLIETWTRQDMNASALVGWIEPLPAGDVPRVDAATAQTFTPSRERVRDRLTLAASGETSLGFDGTSWVGARATACVRLGPICGGATARILTDDTRRSLDVLAGAALPVALSPRLVLVAGVAVGAGSFRSQYERGDMPMTATITGARADVHASLAIAVARHIGLHIGVSVGGSPQAPMTIATFESPISNDEPRGFVRADVGLRIGAP